MKYLIVDDNEEMRKIIRQIVYAEEDIIVECSDGIDVFNAYAEHIPDYVLMDIRMKSMNGIIAAEKLREEFLDARIIIITGYDTPAFRQAAKNVGAIAFFSKENLSELKEFIYSREKYPLNK